MIRLKKLRESKKLTQLQLSQKLNIAQETISGYETGRIFPPSDMLVKLADVLDTSVDYLLERTDVKSLVKNIEFNENELELIAIVRKLNRDKKDCVYTMIKSLDF